MKTISIIRGLVLIVMAILAFSMQSEAFAVAFVVALVLAMLSKIFERKKRH